MIVYEWGPLAAYDPLINPFISINAIIHWTPNKMTLFDASCLIFMLDPVASAGQGILDSFRVVASICKIKEDFFFLR